MSLGKEKSVKRIWFSSREIGLTAALGGLALASNAMGLIIPVAPGICMYTVAAISQVVGGMALSPIMFFVMCTMMYIPRPALVAFLLSFAIFQLPVPTVYFMIRDWPLKYRVPIQWFTHFVILMFPSTIGAMYLYHYLLGWLPLDAVWPTVYLLWGTTGIFQWGILQFIIISVALKFAGDWIRPDWWDRWRGRPTE